MIQANKLYSPPVILLYLTPARWHHIYLISSSEIFFFTSNKVYFRFIQRTVLAFYKHLSSHFLVIFNYFSFSNANFHRTVMDNIQQVAALLQATATNGRKMMMGPDSENDATFDQMMEISRGALQDHEDVICQAAVRYMITQRTTIPRTIRKGSVVELLK